MRPAKTAERIEVLFGVKILKAQLLNIIFGGGHDTSQIRHGVLQITFAIYLKVVYR